MKKVKKLLKNKKLKTIAKLKLKTCKLHKRPLQILDELLEHPQLEGHNYTVGGSDF